MESDEENDSFQSWKGVSGVVILINAFDPSQNGTAARAHVATCHTIKHYLRESSLSNIGVCIYGVENSDASTFGIKGVTEIFPLCTPTLDDYRNLCSNKPANFVQAKEFQLADALWHSSKMFAKCKKQLSSKTIIMLTRMDVPPIESDQKPALNRVVDLVDSHIYLKIVNVSNCNYDVHQFYNNLLIEANKGQEFSLPKQVWDSKDIVKLIIQKHHRHSAVAQLNFEIGNGMFIGVGVHNLLRQTNQTYQKSITLESESNAVVESVTKHMKVSLEPHSSNNSPMDVDNEEKVTQSVPVLQSELLYYLEYGGEKVAFTDLEKKAMSNPFGPPILKLLGFKPEALLCKEKWYLKVGYFLFPNEKVIEGSTVAFKAFHQACSEMSMVAICVLCTRVNAKPKIVALSPCTHPLNLDVEIGFDIINIPFVENIRDIPCSEEEDGIKISQAQKMLMKEILESIKFDYKADMFENPKKQSLLRTLEAIALDEEDSDSLNDTTIRDPNKYMDIKDDLFEDLFGPFGCITKRAAPATNEGGSRKKPKVKDSIDESVLQSKIDSSTLDTYTVEQLKQILKTKGCTVALTSLKKAKLIEMVYETCR